MTCIMARAYLLGELRFHRRGMRLRLLRELIL